MTVILINSICKSTLTLFLLTFPHIRLVFISYRNDQTIFYDFGGLDKKKQLIFVPAGKGLIEEKSGTHNH